MSDPSTAEVLRQIHERRADIAARRRALHHAMAQRHMVPGDDPVELYPTRAKDIGAPPEERTLRVPANLLAQTGQVEHAAKWSRWDRLCAAWAWARPPGGLWWFIGAVIVAAVVDMMLR